MVPFFDRSQVNFHQLARRNIAQRLARAMFTIKSDYAPPEMTGE